MEDGHFIAAWDDWVAVAQERNCVVCVTLFWNNHSKVSQQVKYCAFALWNDLVILLLIELPHYCLGHIYALCILLSLQPLPFKTSNLLNCTVSSLRFESRSLPMLLTLLSSPYIDPSLPPPYSKGSCYSVLTYCIIIVKTASLAPLGYWLLMKLMLFICL